MLTLQTMGDEERSTNRDPVVKLQPAIPGEQSEYLVMTPDECRALTDAFAADDHEAVNRLLGDEIMAVLRARYVMPVPSALFGLPIVLGREIDIDRYFVAMATLTFTLTDWRRDAIPELVERNVASALADYDACPAEYREQMMLTHRIMAVGATLRRANYVPHRASPHKAYALV